MISKKYFFIFSVFAVIALCVGTFVSNSGRENINITAIPDSKFGNFLAAQHAVYVNDLDSAVKFFEILKDSDVKIVKNTGFLINFLSGGEISNAYLDDDGLNATTDFINTATLLKNDDWDVIYKKYKTSENPILAPIRIWSAVATGNRDAAFKYIKSMPVSESWKNLTIGQIWAITKNPKTAAKSFALVDVSFLNLNDYLYLMDFYMSNGFTESGNKLKSDFLNMPGGLFLKNYLDIPFKPMKTYQDAMIFNIMQNVSHNEFLSYSDLSLLLLRFVGLFENDENMLNYYLGLYFANTNGDYEKYFNKIDGTSPYKVFAMHKIAEKTENSSKFNEILNKNPLFVPSIQSGIAKNMQKGRKKDSLSIINNALSDESVIGQSRAFFLWMRAQIYFVSNDLENAQRDINYALNLSKSNKQLLLLQSKIWARQNVEIDTAYDYTMGIIAQNPMDIDAWHTLGMVVLQKEGLKPALEIMERLGEVSAVNSALFETLGDMYTESGDNKQAKWAYSRAIDLSNDGLVIIDNIQRKQRKLK